MGSNDSEFYNSARNVKKKFGGFAAFSSQYLNEHHKSNCHTKFHCCNSFLSWVPAYLEGFQKLAHLPLPFWKWNRFKEQNNLNIVIEILYKACNLTFGLSQPLSLFYYPRGLPRPRPPPRPSSITLTLTLTVFGIGENIGLSNSTNQKKKI